MKIRIFLFNIILLSIITVLNNRFFSLDVRADEKDNKKIVAIVNGQELSRDKLADLLIDTYGNEGLDILIKRTLVGQEAKKLNVRVTEEEVNKRIEDIVEGMIKQQMKRGGLENQDDLKRELEKAGLNIEEYKKNIIKSLKLTRAQVEAELLAETIIKKTINITDEDLHEAYEEKYGEKIIAWQIVLRTMREAEKVLEKIKAGADFEAMARKESIDRASASRGGKMRPLEPHGILGKATEKLKKGEVSEIIKTDSGYHILKIENRIPRSMNKFSEVKKELELFVTARKVQNRISPWLLNLVESAEITRNLPD